MDREDTIEKEQAGEERARTQVLRAQETGTNYESTMETLRQAEQELPSFSGSYDDEIGRLYDRIGVIAYLIGEAVKISPADNKYIPVICGTAGALLGVAAMYTVPEFPAGDIINAIAVGIVSGLSATGADQIAKQMKK